MTDRCANERCYAGDGISCAEGEVRQADCPSWKIGQLTALCQKYRKKMLVVCSVDSVRDDVPKMLDNLRGHLDNSIELSDDDVRNIYAGIDVLEFLLETEPPAGAAPGEKLGHV